VSGARSAAGTQAEASADAAITADRVETKYLLDRAAVRVFVQQALRKLPEHRFVGEGANLLPDPQHFVTSIYFDTATQAHYRAAVSDVEHNVKIRAREYYDLMPSLAELATEPGQIVRYQPWVWFEVKQRDQGRSRKLRFRLPKRDVPAFFRGEHPAFARVELGGSEHEPTEHDAQTHDASELSSIVDYLRTLKDPLVPSCIVNYRRLALQDATGTLRITVDLDIGYYAAPGDLWARSHALVRGTFGRPAKIERCALVEVKRGGPAPAWLEHELHGLSVRAVPYSKFVHAAGAVHAEQLQREGFGG